MDDARSAPETLSVPPAGSGQGRLAVSRLPAILMMTLFASTIGVHAHFLTSKEAREFWQKPHSSRSVVQGEAALDIEKAFKEGFPIRDFATGLLNAISLSAFDEARKGLVKGAEGWFFTDEEFTWNRKSAATVDKNIAFVRSSVAALKAANIQTIILLIPEKADIYRDKLGNIAAPASRAALYGDIHGELSALGADVPDLRALFLASRKDGDVFLKSDTHWTVAGAGIAAKAVASRLESDQTLVRGDFTLSEEPQTTHSGDLMKFAKLSVLSRFIELPTDQITPMTARKAEASLDDLLADDPAGPEVALVGSSYSANATWSFEAQLKAFARLDTINFAEEGKGPFKPMQGFLADKLRKQTGLRYVIWEMPLRYFDETAYGVF